MGMMVLEMKFAMIKEVNLAEDDERAQHDNHRCAGIACTAQHAGVDLIDAAEHVERRAITQQHGTVCDDLCFTVEERDELRREDEQRDCQNDGCDDGHDKRCACALLGAGDLIDAEVLSDECGRRERETASAGREAGQSYCTLSSRTCSLRRSSSHKTVQIRSRTR